VVESFSGIFRNVWEGSSHHFTLPAFDFFYLLWLGQRRAPVLWAMNLKAEVLGRV
jgi:hypothetical protein